MATLFSYPSTVPAQTQEPILYTGAFRALQFDLGTAPPFADDQWVVGLSARAATVLSLLDGELSYGLRMGETGRVHRLGVSTHLHPLALTALLNHQWGRWLSAASVHLGGGSALSEGQSQTALGFYWSYGAALDVPLSNPDLGSALWLGLVYENIAFSAAIEQIRGGSVSLRLAYRANGI